MRIAACQIITGWWKSRMTNASRSDSRRLCRFSIVRPARRYCAARRSSTAAKPSVAWRCGLATGSRPSRVSDALVVQHLLRRHQHELGMVGQELFDDAFVLGVEHAAGRVDEPAALLHQARALARIDACFGVSSSIAVRVWRHFRSGLRRSVAEAADGASTSTRSILPEPLDLRVVFAVDQHGFTFDSPLRARRGFSFARRFSDVERVEAPGRAHHRAARASCRPRPRRNRRPSRRGAASAAAGCLRPAPRSRLPRTASGASAPACRPRARRTVKTASRRIDAFRAQPVDGPVTAGLLHVGAQVERRRVVQRGLRAARFRRRRNGPTMPGGSSRAGSCGCAPAGLRIDLRHVLEPCGLGVGQERLQRIAASRLHQAEQREASRAGVPVPLSARCENSILRRSTANTASAITPRSACRASDVRGRTGSSSHRRRRTQHLGQQSLGLADQESVQFHTPSLVSVCG